MNRQTILRSILILLFSCSSTSSYGGGVAVWLMTRNCDLDDIPLKNNGTLKIHITNASGQTCHLTNEGIPLHGYFRDSTAPTVLNRNSSYDITLEQSLFRGPAIILKYNCNGRVAEFKSTQNRVSPRLLMLRRCHIPYFLNVHGKVYQAEGLSVTYTLYDDGSGRAAGRIDWIIR